MSHVNMAATKNVRVLSDAGEVSEKVCAFIIETANAAIADRAVFTVGVSGGSLAKILSDGLPALKTDWSKWRVFFCDERHVPFDDPECTYSVYKKNLLSKVPIQDEYVFPDNPNIPVEEAAEAYTQKLEAVFGKVGLPKFDMLLLGMGPDGHTCSLFPGHPLLNETKKWVAAISDSPKPPPQRITLTFPVIQNCRCAVFVSCGSSKAEILKRVLEGNEEPALPAARVRPHTGALCWFLDKPAASLLKSYS
ncbi:hypothetical protein NP493_115g10026 [Ridgeia piscesae]|uniref:6-phosphogluconolactonase n=1 Tax=Ridgeia piscesae TaxID=27915 RepID=A0AAD9P6Z0_RIDPI|nr:hypothetical protein NP493_115g10026 [Ridgeia piscesae]